MAEDDGRNSLGAMMFGSVADGLKGLAKSAGIEVDEPAPAPAPAPSGGAPSEGDSAAVERMVAGVDERAKTGELSYDDFLDMGRTFVEMGGKMPGMPGTLTDAQIKETTAKFRKHEKIVNIMFAEERADPQLMFDDLADTANKCPRTQRIAAAAGLPEREVGLFIAEFEGMRESTMRIAAGEDPDAVNSSMDVAPPGASRAARRAAKKSQKAKGK